MSLLPIRSATGALAGALVAMATAAAYPYAVRGNLIFHRTKTMTPRLRIIAAMLAFVCGATGAFAHARLEKAAPPAGGTVASTSEIRLTFSEGVEQKFSKVTVTGPGGAAVPLGPAKTEAGDQAVLIAPITKALAPGAYTVHWQAVSVDTHHTQGTFQFTVNP